MIGMSSIGTLPSSLVIFGSKFCRSSSYLLSQPLCPVIEAAHFAWPGFLLGQRHRPIMPRQDFLGLLKWMPMPFPSRIEHFGPLGAIKKMKGDLNTLQTDLSRILFPVLRLVANHLSGPWVKLAIKLLVRNVLR